MLLEALKVLMALISPMLLCRLVALCKTADGGLLLVPGQGRGQDVAASDVVDGRRGEAEVLESETQRGAERGEQAVF